MFATKNTVIVPEIHGKQDANNNINLGGVPNLELESGTTGAPGHIIQQDGGKFDLQFGRMMFPPGHILQVIQTVKTDTFSTGNTSNFIEITGYNVSITPSSSSNKILIFVCLHIGENQDAFPLFKMYRDTTELTIAPTISPGTAGMFAKVTTGNDSRDQYLIEPVNFQFLDSPNTTSSITYSIKVRPFGAGTRTVFVNRSQTIGDANQVTAISTLTAMEVAG